MSDLSSSDPCLSDLSLDQLRTRELNDDARDHVNAHLERCATCRARRDHFAARHAAYLAAVPSFAALAERASGARATAAAGRDQRGRVPADRKMRSAARVRAAVLGFAAAAATALLVSRYALTGPVPGEPVASGTLERGNVTREKGAPDVGYFVKRGERVVRGESGQLLRAGDRLRFTYTSARPQQFALFNRDGRGARVYYPPGPRSAALAAGKGVALGFGIELDDYVGEEQVLALFCEEPFELEPVRAALERGEPQSAPAGCTQRTLELKKERAP
ncbi:MAG TPA: hypothetical protein VK509_01390 [Polyangiales bacterium]|nr:hypothetical protein [Polyangiales bacterium]